MLGHYPPLIRLARLPALRRIVVAAAGFDPFGAGLGLFVAQGIIEAHDGRIEVSSELGSGASFRFSLPMFEEETGGSRDMQMSSASNKTDTSR